MQRQVIIEKAPEATTNGMADLTEKELVTKANLAIEMMDSDDIPEGAIFVGVTKLRRGAALFQLNTKEAADWLCREDNVKAFLEQLGGTSILKMQHLNTVVEFVPITFNPDTPDALRDIERASGLPQGSIASTKYFKPAHRRTPQQQTAHTLFGFNTHESANLAIEHGIFVESKWVQVRKLQQELRRCVKCQQVGANHIVAECLLIHDTCTRCGDMHKTTECTVTDPAKFRCVNCKGDTAKGHGAADKRCPHFLEKLTQTQAQNTENRYHYFPTSNPQTREATEPSNPQTNNQSVTWQEDNQWRGGWTQGMDTNSD